MNVMIRQRHVWDILYSYMGGDFLLSAVNGSPRSTRLLALLHIWRVFFGASLELARAFFSSLRAEFLFSLHFFSFLFFWLFFITPDIALARHHKKEMHYHRV